MKYGLLAKGNFDVLWSTMNWNKPAVILMPPPSPCMKMTVNNCRKSNLSVVNTTVSDGAPYSILHECKQGIPVDKNGLVHALLAV